MACRGGPSSCVLGTVIWWYSQTGAPSNVDLSFSVVVVVIVVVSVEVDVLLALRCTETADLLLLLRPDKDGEKPITPDGKIEIQQSDPTSSRWTFILRARMATYLRNSSAALFYCFFVQF